MEKIKSFAVTIRPLDGVTDEQVTMFANYLRKQCDYYHLVTEKTMAERHIHAGFILKKEISRSNLSTNLMRLFKDLTPTEKSVLRKGLRIMYNWDFVNNYLNKDDDTVVIQSHLPEEGHIESFFPPKPTPVSETIAKKCSLYYHELERMWYEHVSPGTEVNTMEARNFLFNVMYNKRCLAVIRDDKQIIQTARHLVRWLNKEEYSTIELAPFEKEE